MNRYGRHEPGIGIIEFIADVRRAVAFHCRPYGRNPCGLSFRNIQFLEEITDAPVSVLARPDDTLGKVIGFQGTVRSAYNVQGIIPVMMEAADVKDNRARFF